MSSFHNDQIGSEHWWVFHSWTDDVVLRTEAQCFGCFQAPDVATREMSWPKEWTNLYILFEHMGLPVIRMVQNFKNLGGKLPSMEARSLTVGGHFSSGADFQVLFISSCKKVAESVSMSCDPKIYACLIAKSMVMLLLYTKYWIYQDRKKMNCHHRIFQVCLSALNCGKMGLHIWYSAASLSTYCTGLTISGFCPRGKFPCPLYQWWRWTIMISFLKISLGFAFLGICASPVRILDIFCPTGFVVLRSTGEEVLSSNPP